MQSGSTSTGSAVCSMAVELMCASEEWLRGISFSYPLTDCTRSVLGQQDNSCQLHSTEQPKCTRGPLLQAPQFVPCRLNSCAQVRSGSEESLFHTLSQTVQDLYSVGKIILVNCILQNSQNALGVHFYRLRSLFHVG